MAHCQQEQDLHYASNTFQRSVGGLGWSPCWTNLGGALPPLFPSGHPPPLGPDICCEPNKDTFPMDSNLFYSVQQAAPAQPEMNSACEYVRPFVPVDTKCGPENSVLHAWPCILLCATFHHAVLNTAFSTRSAAGSGSRGLALLYALQHGPKMGPGS